MQRPREAQQTQECHNITPHEGQPHLGTPRGAETEAESSRARGHGPYLTPGEEGNEATLRGNVGNDELNPPQQGIREWSWEQRFKGLQQELSRMKEVDAGASINTPNIGNSALIIEELDWGGQDALNTCENSFFGPHLGLGRQKNVIRLGQTPDVKLPY